MIKLTPRRRQVLCLAALSNREIAARLGISWMVVKYDITNIRKALGLAAVDYKPVRLHLLLVALERHIISLDEIELPPPPGWCWERVEQARAAVEREMGL